MNRSLSWNQDNNNVLAPYSLPAGPQAAIWLEAYPAAFSSSGFASRIGVFGEFNQGFGVNSTANGGATKLTTAANAFMSSIHDRMPVVVSAQDRAAWLDPEAGDDALVPLLRSAPENVLVAHAVSTRVNSPANDAEDLITRVG